jgi:hypothetical protein
MMMFSDLDDPAPPVPTATTLHRVQARARVLRHRRRMAVAAPAAAALGAVSLASLQLRQEGPAEIDAVATSTPAPPPTTGFDVTRGGELSLAEVPAGWEQVSDRVRNDPLGGLFSRTLAFRPVGSDPESETAFTVGRWEMSASGIAEFASQPGAVQSVRDGQQVISIDVPGSRAVAALIDGNLVIVVQGESTELDLFALLDSVEFTVPTVRCVEGEVIVERPECAALEHELDVAPD